MLDIVIRGIQILISSIVAVVLYTICDLTIFKMIRNRANKR